MLKHQEVCQKFVNNLNICQCDKDMFRQVIDLWKHDFDDAIIQFEYDTIRLTWVALKNNIGQFVQFQYCYHFNGQWVEPNEYITIIDNHNLVYFLDYFDGIHMLENHKIANEINNKLKLDIQQFNFIYQSIANFRGDLESLDMKYVNEPLINSSKLTAKFDILSDIQICIKTDLNTNITISKITDYYYCSIEKFITHISDLQNNIN